MAPHGALPLKKFSGFQMAQQNTGFAICVLTLNPDNATTYIEVLRKVT